MVNLELGYVEDTYVQELNNGLRITKAVDLRTNTLATIYSKK
jgi:hypothetical protein